MRSYLDFEKPVAELEAKVEELRALGENRDAVSITEDIAGLEAKAAAALKELYSRLTPWQKTLVARHPQRPHFVDYCAGLIEDFTPLAGDRSFGDTAGAYPGIEAEERGQAEAIARSTEMQLGLKVPNVSVVIGEGGSGGAIAIATANKVLMLEHAIYSVISPEGAASILWRDPGRAQDAATNMKITAQDLLRPGIIYATAPRSSWRSAASSEAGRAVARTKHPPPSPQKTHNGPRYGRNATAGNFTAPLTPGPPWPPLGENPFRGTNLKRVGGGA